MNDNELTKQSLDWAIDSIIYHSDGDLFPRLPEFTSISEKRVEFINMIRNSTLSKLCPGPSRRFIVPKDGLSYRQATQLDPQDSIILTALMRQHGQKIENMRLDSDRVFSYRFLPSDKFSLYSGKASWNTYWGKAHQLSAQSSCVLKCDISDFYNQIYHHTIEQQLEAARLQQSVIDWITRLLSSTTSGVSRGIPIGPHATHMLSECALIPIDNATSVPTLELGVLITD